MDLDPAFLRQAIPALRTALSAERITAGYSTSAKYLISYPGGARAVLRVAPDATNANNEELVQVLAELRAVGARVPAPLDAGQVGNRAYCLLSFIEGEAALDALGRCPPDVQYAVGVQAGADLRRMHRVLPARPVRPWDERILGKHRAALAAYWAGGARVEHDEEVAAFIEANEDAVRGRPSHFQHGDFHVANLVMRDQRYAGAIDFDRWDWGDPYQEFLKVGFFSCVVSVPFCNGQIHGYFNGAIPDGFWRLCAVYTAMSVLGAVVWARRRTPEEVDEMVEFSNRVTGDYDQFRSVVPRWFQPVRG